MPTWMHGSPGTWTPAQSSVVRVWLDGGLSTITQSGGLVSQWNDLSGNGFNAVQATGGNQPTTGTRTQNSINAIAYNGTTSFMTVTATLPKNSTGVSMYSAVAHDAAADGWDMFMTNAAANDFSASLGRTSNANHVGGDGANFALYSDSSTAFRVVSSTVTQTAKQIWQDGTSMGTNANSDAAKTSGKMWIGSDNNPVSFFNGIMGTLIVVEGESSLADRQRFEGYLAWRWGKQANLPGGHPYMSAPP
jgi:hypothetical protein